jgi:tetratricopeptide (TPR) repeat protein
MSGARIVDSSEIQGSLVNMTQKDARLLLESGYLWMDMGQFDKAREIFMGCAALMPKSDAPHLALGTLEFAQGRHQKALQSYRAAQKLSPKSGLARAYAGEALLFMGKVTEAMKELKAAQTLDPDGDGARLAQALLEAKESGVLPPKADKRK